MQACTTAVSTRPSCCPAHTRCASSVWTGSWPHLPGILDSSGIIAPCPTPGELHLSWMQRWRIDHTFYFSGLNRCPICRELITIPRGGVQALPPSFLVNQLLDLMARQRREVIPKCSTHHNQVGILFSGSVCITHVHSTSNQYLLTYMYTCRAATELQMKINAA